MPIIRSAFERDFSLSEDSSDRTLSMRTIEPIKAPRIAIVAPKPTFSSSHGTRDSRYAEPAKIANAAAIFRIEFPRASILAASPIAVMESLIPVNTSEIDFGRAAMSRAARPNSRVPRPPARTPILQIGRASCRERVETPVGEEALKINRHKQDKAVPLAKLDESETYHS